MSGWERLVYVLVHAVADAWFDALDRRAIRLREKPSAEDRLRTSRFADLVLVSPRRPDPGQDGGA